MSCAYRTHRYRSSVTAHLASVSWNHVTGHPHHPISLRLPVVRPERQVVTETGTSTDDAPIPVSLVQYLWAQWHQAPPEDRESVARFVGTLMRSPRWHWDVTVLPDPSLPDPQGPFVSERDGRPTIGMPITMLRELWVWVLRDIRQRSAIMQWIASGIDSSLWQELCTYQRVKVPWLTKRERYPLYGYLPPLRLPNIVRATDHLLSSADPDDQQMALTVLDQWLASPDSATRTLAAQMLRTWLHARTANGTVTDAHRQLRLRALTILASYDDPAVISACLYDLLRTEQNRITPDDVRTMMTLLHGLGDGRSLATNRWMSLLGEMVRDHPSDDVIREVLDRLMPTILPSVRPDDRVAWVTTLWEVVSDPTCSDGRRLAIAGTLRWMMQQDPTGATLVHPLLCTTPPLHPSIPAPVWDTLLAGLMTTAEADAVLDVIETAIRQNRRAIARFDSILAAGWGHGHDHRILQIIDSIPGPWWNTVLETGITTSVGAEVCAFIQSQVPPDQAVDRIVHHINARERRGDWPLAPLPAYLIPWVCDAARACPHRLHPTTIRRLWLAAPVRAWDVTQTMLDSDDPSVQRCAIAAMDAGWGTGYDAEVATTLRSIMLDHQDDSVVATGIATAVAGLGAAPPSIMESLLTSLATMGNAPMRRQLVHALHRGWGRGQDALVMRIVEMIAERDSSEWVWGKARATLVRAWDYLPPHVVVSLLDRLVTRGMHRRYFPIGEATAAFAPIWTHLPTPLVIARIAHHVAHLHAHAHTIGTYSRDTLVSAWASVVTAGAARLSASEFRAVLAPLWNLSPESCLDGVWQWVRR